MATSDFNKEFIKYNTLHAEELNTLVSNTKENNSSINNIETKLEKLLDENDKIIITAEDVGALTASSLVPFIEGFATKEELNAAVTNLVNGAPDTLDTINELAAALGGNPNIVTDLTELISKKVDKTLQINKKELKGDIDLSAADVGAVSLQQTGGNRILVTDEEGVVTTKTLSNLKIVTNNFGTGNTSTFLNLDANGDIKAKAITPSVIGALSENDIVYTPSDTYTNVVGVLKVNGNEYKIGIPTRILDYVSTSSEAVQTIKGGLNVGGNPEKAAGTGRVIVTGQGNPLFGLQSYSSGKFGTSFYLQVTSEDKLYLGPTSTKAMSFDADGNISVPSSSTVSILGTLNAAKLIAPIATSDTDGLMAAADKQKIDNLSNSINTSISSLIGVPNGIADLDDIGKIPISRLPSYVDEIQEYDNSDFFPATGETGKIYIDLSTNKTYRWGGSTYVEISASLTLGTTSSTAYRGDRGQTAYNHAVAKGSAFGSGLYKITTNSHGHVTVATPVAKDDITNLGIPAQDTTYGLATAINDGLMSAEDKKKISSMSSEINAIKNKFSSYATITSAETIAKMVLKQNINAANGVASLDENTKVAAKYLPTAANGIFGIVKTTSEITSIEGLTACPIIEGVPYYKDISNSYLPLAGGNVTGHIYLTGAKEDSSTSNTSQIVFGTPSNNHVALSSNANTLVVNPTTSSTTNQIVLYLDKPSQFPCGINWKHILVTAKNASTTISGLMSAADKLKLDKIAQSNTAGQFAISDGQGGITWQTIELASNLTY